jgi:drug/metabolite transporter (DMT)-like permease
MEMFAGGILLLVAGIASGEWSLLDVSSVTPLSALSLVYLLVFGSLIGFTAYVWLLKQTTPARAATYAYVNPIVAVVLGWFFADEPLTGRTLLSAAVIVGAVVIVTLGRKAAPASSVIGTAAATPVLSERE